MQCEQFRSVPVPPIMKACMKKVPVIMWFVTGYGVVGYSVVASVSLHAARRRQQKGCTEDEKVDEMYACLRTGLGTVLFSLLSLQFQNSSGTDHTVQRKGSGTVRTVLSYECE